jgi:hypothetical protein
MNQSAEPDTLKIARRGTLLDTVSIKARTMSQDLITLPTDELLTKFGAGMHNPGSGSAAALLGLVSCKLVQTVISLSHGRDKYQGVER